LGLLVARLIEEEIDAVASPATRRIVIAAALADAGHGAMPTDPDTLALFVRKELRATMVAALGTETADELCDRLAGMLPAPPPVAAMPSTMPPPAYLDAYEYEDEISAVIPRDTLRLGASTETVWIVAYDVRNAHELAAELAAIGITSRMAPSVPPIRSSRSAIILDLRGATIAVAETWIRRASDTDAIVVAWGGPPECDGDNVYACESILEEREVALYCASLLV
jgi:hypothetical protein